MRGIILCLPMSEPTAYAPVALFSVKLPSASATAATTGPLLLGVMRNTNANGTTETPLVT